MARFRNPRAVQLRLFQCPECGTRQTMPKYKRCKTVCGHVKTAWCFKCMARRQFIQIEV